MTTLEMAEACEALTACLILVPGLDTVECAKALRRLDAWEKQEHCGYLTSDGDFIANQRYIMTFGQVPKATPLITKPKEAT